MCHNADSHRDGLGGCDADSNRLALQTPEGGREDASGSSRVEGAGTPETPALVTLERNTQPGTHPAGC